MRWKVLPFLVVLWANQARGMEMPISLESGTAANVSIGSCFDPLPGRNYAPVELKINNFSGATQRWTFRFTNPSYSNSGPSMSSSTTVTVDNNTTRTVPFLVPNPPHSSNRWREPLEVTVDGYGAQGGQQGFGMGPYSGKPRTPYLVISNQLGTSMWSGLKAALDTKGQDLYGSLVDPLRLPEDWRGLSGVDAIFLTNGEIGQLSAKQRDTLRTWVHLGGDLMICGDAGPLADFQTEGFGKVKYLASVLDQGAVITTIAGLSKQEDIFHHLPNPRDNIGPVAPNVPLLICVMGLFAALVGPVNIFYFAREGRRHRLFWTTPLISVGMSGILMAFIFLQDGLGGRGSRVAFVYVTPQDHSEVVLQQQTSRTGLLLGSEFQTRDPVIIEQMEDAQGGVDSYRARRISLENNGTTYRGDWFTSRTVQTQQIQSVLPTRGEISLVNSADLQDPNVAPVILSSFALPLDHLVYFDSQKRCWTGKDIHAGQKQVLVRTNPDAVFSRSLRLEDRPGSFMASSTDPSALVDTLPSIQWHDQQVFYLGMATTP